MSSVKYDFIVLSPANRGKHNLNEGEEGQPPLWVANTLPKGVVGRPSLEEGDAGKTIQKKGWDMGGMEVKDRVEYLQKRYAELGEDYEGDYSPLDNLPPATRLGGTPSLRDTLPAASLTWGERNESEE